MEQSRDEKQYKISVGRTLERENRDLKYLEDIINMDPEEIRWQIVK